MPTRTAPLAAGWARGNRNLPGPVMGASRPGVPFLVPQLGTNARLSVELAWGANLANNADTWSWTDITGDVQQADGQKITVTVGRADEASQTQPAQCAMQLDNRAGLYSLGGQSPNWPNVRRNVPVRVRVDPGTGPVTVFYGFADGFTPGWDVTGTNAIVTLTASGTLRRLQQGTSPVLSSLRRVYTTLNPRPTAYWPAEDKKNATHIASAFAGDRAMTFTGTPEFDSNSKWPSSAPIPVLNNSVWTGPVPQTSTTGTVEVFFLTVFPDAGLTNGTILERIYTNGTVARWDLVYGTGGTLALNGYDVNGNSVLASSAGLFNVNGDARLVAVALVQYGADIDWTIATVELGATSSLQHTGTLASQTVTNATRVIIAPNGDIDMPAGQVVVFDRLVLLDPDEVNAFDGDTARERIDRLSDENAVPVNVIGSALATMGPQTVDTLLNLLREAETADQGVLHDGLSAGLTYVARQTRENATAALTLNASGGQLAAPFLPVDDDQRNRNKVEAVRKGGTSYVHEDEDGPLGTDTIGTYDSSVTVNVETDEQIPHYAGWLVHLGTVEGYRYPTLSLNLAHNPELVPAWLAASLGARLDTTNVEDVRTQHPAGTISLLLEGYTQTIDQFLWEVTLNCSPYQPWRIGVAAAVSGDTDENLIHLDTSGSALAAGVAAGATSLSVTTTTGPIWSTDADDVPFDIDVGGIQVTVTAIAGASSPQTFTVTGATVTRAFPGGTPVKVWNPPVLGLE